MIELHFAGWAVCRLATNPDPYDDPRGTRSGFQQFAYAGEPDLDRVIWLNNPPFQRPHTPLAGVVVERVIVNGQPVSAHMLNGAQIDLIDNPVFDGRNGVIATDAAEPIYPFHLAIGKGDLRLTRRKSPTDPNYPYPEYLPSEAGPYAGLPDLPPVFARIDHSADYARRLQLIRDEFDAGDETSRPGLGERIEVLETMQGPRANFPFAMRWTLALTDPPVLAGGSLDGLDIDLGSLMPWWIDVWFGAYDRDGQSFFVSGTLKIPLGSDPSA